MSDTVKIKVWVETNRVGSTVEDVLEFDREEWESMNDLETENVLRDWMWNFVEWGWEEVCCND